MNCKIISPYEEKKFESLTSITLPSSNGEMQILPKHADSFIEIRTGNIILEGEKTIQLHISQGVCYIKNNNILLIQ